MGGHGTQSDLPGDFLLEPVALGSQSDSCIKTVGRSPSGVRQREVGQGDNVQDCLPDVVGPTFGQWNSRSEAGGHALLSNRRRRLYADTEVSV